MIQRKGLLAVLLILAIICTTWLAYSWFFVKKHRYLTTYGNVDIRDVALAFRVPGKLKAMCFEEGTFVKKNTLLAMLDDDTYTADLNMAQAEYDETKASYENAARSFTRRNKLIGSGAVSQALYDDSIAEKAQTQAALETGKARIDTAKIALNDTKLYAPTDGIIMTRAREPGTILSQGEPVYTLTLDNPVWIRTYVNEPILGKIYPGQKALVYTDSRPKKPYEGHIGFISPQAEFTPKTVETTELRTDLVYRLRVIVNNPDRGLRQGMPVTVHILQDAKHHEQ